MRPVFQQIGGSQVAAFAIALADGSQFVVPGSIVDPARFKREFAEVKNGDEPGAFAVAQEDATVAQPLDTSSFVTVDQLEGIRADLAEHDAALEEVRVRLGEATVARSGAGEPGSAGAAGISGSSSIPANNAGLTNGLESNVNSSGGTSAPSTPAAVAPGSFPGA